MSYWLVDHELFLYAKGHDDVILRRCKKLASSSSSGSSLVVPMKSDDFDYVSNVENHLELIGGMSVWEEPDYKRLVKYIYEKRLLVNGQGLVITELMHKVDKDGKKTIDDANEEDVPAIYIRSLDVLPLNSYIPNLMEQPIPLRTVKYLGDVNGKAAMMEEDSNVTKLTARVDDLESKNKTLDTNITKLTGNVADLQSKNKNLEAENKTLDTNVTKLTGNVADLQSKNKNLEAENKTLDTNVTELTGNVADLQSKNKILEAENKTLDSNIKTLEGKVTKLTADMVTLQQEVKNINANTKEAWMNDITSSTNWVGVEGLQVWTYNHLNPRIIHSLGTFTEDEDWTNVRARYWYPLKESGGFKKAVSLENLTPNKEKARFREGGCRSFKSEGKTYVLF